MTPAKLHALADVHAYVNRVDDTEPKVKPSTNPAADLAALANL